jgi:hypothetical protein
LHLDFACVVVTGGGAKTDILRQALAQVLEEHAINVRIRHITTDLPYVKGALMHHFFQEDRLSPVSNFLPIIGTRRAIGDLILGPNLDNLTLIIHYFYKFQCSQDNSLKLTSHQPYAS